MSLFVIAYLSSLVLCFSLHLLLRHLRRRIPLPPGPHNLPILGALPFIGPMPHSGLARLARRHGPIMFLKMGLRRVVVASSSAAARSFLKELDAQFSDRPTGVISKDITYNGQDMVFADYGPKWKLLRKVSSLHLLGTKAMARWAGVRRDEAGCLLQFVKKQSDSGKPVLLPDVLVCAMANVIGRISMSKRVFYEEGKEAKEFTEMIKELLVGQGAANIGDLVPVIRWLDPLGVRKKMLGLHQRFDRMISKLMVEHAEKAGEREGMPDLLDLVSANKVAGEDGEDLCQENIKGFIACQMRLRQIMSSLLMQSLLGISMGVPPPISLRLSDSQPDLDYVGYESEHVSVSPHLPHDDLESIPPDYAYDSENGLTKVGSKKSKSTQIKKSSGILRAQRIRRTPAKFWWG